MRKFVTSLAAMLSLSFFAQAQMEQYGPFVGGHAFVYKSNLFNSDDFRSDSVQKYKATMGFGGGFDYGYKGENGVSISSGLYFGTNNQKYGSEDTIVGDVLTFSAETKMSFLKVPLIISIQTRNESNLKAYYSLGAYICYNTGYSETINWDYKHNNSSLDLETTIEKKMMTSKYKGDSNTYSWKLDKRPYRRLGIGAIAAVGVSQKLSKQLDGYIQAKLEYQITNAEYSGETTFTPNNSKSGARYIDHLWGNYAKYMPDKKSDYERWGTHPFNLGVTFGLRYFIFKFDE
ncbi:MAG: outer membrane beta-barrel protein [Chitinophagaceae bacterium]|nr:outer membrane beta-barrel protein [Chitinophagaceae bacterium]